eukprot:CAMPEP_0114997670 /NCGR_PEP_ID=MMETSP0216-20121206/15039_1 /TAXON_ID=223996 /ORGANISM="Protocruzia adherens, Strain Boccale" /LENGTH=411 /DNA_ID=CAMNT_0002362099 /DNA_START=217 /DNA_END=1452 /DNA_ORIENTATION=-
METMVEELYKLEKIYYTDDEKEIITNKVNEILKYVDAVPQNQGTKVEKSRMMFLKGRTLDMLPEFSKTAEEALSKSVKLNPQNNDAWNTLGHIFWKKKDYTSSRKCFETALDKCGDDKVALRSLSILLRSMGEDTEKAENVVKSVELAKRAIGLDLKDGESWYVLGNAHLTNFFNNMSGPEDLDKAMKAYIQAETHGQSQNPDLHFNRAQVACFLEHYDKSLENFHRAHELDPGLNAEKCFNSLLSFCLKMNSLIASKGKLKQRKLSTIAKNIPCAFKSKINEDGSPMPEMRIVPFNELSVGVNNNVIFSCRVMCHVPKMQEVPVSFLVVDFKESFTSVSVYNFNEDIHSHIVQYSDIFVINPIVERVRVTYGDKEIDYHTIKVFDPNNILINSRFMKEIFAQPKLVNKTF